MESEKRDQIALPLDWKSCVYKCKFRAPELNQMFAFLRDKEKIYARDVLRWRGVGGKEIQAVAALHEVQAMLIWMSANIREAGDLTQRRRRRRNG